MGCPIKCSCVTACRLASGSLWENISLIREVFFLLLFIFIIMQYINFTILSLEQSRLRYLRASWSQMILCWMRPPFQLACQWASSRPHSKQMWDNVMLSASSTSFHVARFKPRTHPGGFASFPMLSITVVPSAQALVLLSLFSQGNPKPCTSQVGDHTFSTLGRAEALLRFPAKFTIPVTGRGKRKKWMEDQMRKGRVWVAVGFF